MEQYRTELIKFYDIINPEISELIKNNIHEVGIFSLRGRDQVLILSELLKMDLPNLRSIIFGYNRVMIDRELLSRYPNLNHVYSDGGAYFDSEDTDLLMMFIKHKMTLDRIDDESMIRNVRDGRISLYATELLPLYNKITSEEDRNLLIQSIVPIDLPNTLEDKRRMFGDDDSILDGVTRAMMYCGQLFNIDIFMDLYPQIKHLDGYANIMYKDASSINRVINNMLTIRTKFGDHTLRYLKNPDVSLTMVDGVVKDLTISRYDATKLELTQYVTKYIEPARSVTYGYNPPYVQEPERVLTTSTTRRMTNVQSSSTTN